MREWIDVAAASSIGTKPFPVTAAGQPVVLVRFTPDGEVRAFPGYCPHRFVPLAAASSDNGVLRCPYHGWEFDGDGICVTVPSSGPDTTPPPRASIGTVPVREHDGRVHVGPVTQLVPRGLLTNEDPALASAWHPVALADEIGTGRPVPVRLLGRSYTLSRDDSGVIATPGRHARRH